jgi:PDDEXK-like domain of unknown function (DUF3799)
VTVEEVTDHDAQGRLRLDVEITEPGVYDVDHDTYHADPVPGGSLSSTGARALLPPSCPAKFRYLRDHGEAPRKAWDIGQAAHTAALGVGPELRVIEGGGGPDGDMWNTKVAKAAVAQARADGAVPLKPSEMDTVQAMVAALRADPIAGPLFTPGVPGRAEASLFWRDTVTGVWCRSRIDWLPDADPDTGRLVLLEYKTAASCDPTALQKAAYDHGYHVQAWWQVEACRALRLSPAPLLVFVFQEKDPPYLPVVKQPYDSFLNLGGVKAREAMDTYARCTKAELWPSYPGAEEVDWLRLPPWVENQWGDEIKR